MGSLLFFPWRQNKWDILNGAESPRVERCPLSTFLRYRGRQVEAGRGWLTLPGGARACLCSQLEGGEEGTRSPLGWVLTDPQTWPWGGLPAVTATWPCPTPLTSYLPICWARSLALLHVSWEEFSLAM